MTAFDDLLAWSSGRPPWQQDALRRIVEFSELSPDDTASVLEILKAGHGLPSRGGAAEPMGMNHIPDRRPDAPPVLLVSLGSLAGVNAIAADQTISFAATGITAIYGDNGAGKSGYIRVLRKACRARDPGPPILGNAFGVEDRSPCSGTLVFSEDGDALEFRWSSAANSPAALSRVTVFDRDSAAVYVTRENELAFLPMGLDVMERLAALCDVLRSQLRHELAAEPPPDVAAPEAVAAHLATSGMWPISARTNLDAMPRAALAPAELDELERLSGAVATVDPAAQANVVRRLASRFAAFADRLDVAQRRLDGEQLGHLAEALNALILAQEAADAAAQVLTASTDLSGVGGDSWRRLWDAARDYAEEIVHPGHPFPGSSDRCVLCHQQLNEEARGRFSRFEAFVRDRTTSQLQAARALVQGIRTDIEAIQVARDGDEDILFEIQERDAGLVERIRSVVDTLRARRDAALRAIETKEWVEPPPQRPSPVGPLRALCGRLNDHASAMDVAANAREEARTRVAELEARRWVAAHSREISSRVDWLVRQGRYQDAIAATDTTAITREGSTLTARWATQELADAFSDELQALASGEVRVNLRRAGGERGVAHHRLELEGARIQGIAVADVLSEGEHRAVALAAFFAEALAGGTSALVADDPTSSLDHRYRRRIARRFVQVAADRQVAIFTHDIVFLSELDYEARQEGVPVSYQHLTREGDRVGISEPGLPWHAQRINERLQWLDDALPAIRLLHNNHSESYETEARHFYGRLRQAWERAVEEVLLNESITRFSPAVQTQRLRLVSDVTPDDFRVLDAGMTKASSWLEGHDQPLAANEGLPDPDEIASDLRELRAWVRGIRQRRGG